MSKADHSNRPKTICPKCGDNISNCSYKRHLRSCTGTKVSRVYIPKSGHGYNFPEDQLFCKYCGKQCKNGNSLVQHELRCPKNIDRRDYQKLTKYIQNHVKGTTKSTNPSIQKQVDTMRRKYSNGYVSPNKGKSNKVSVYLYQDQIDDEINLWRNFIASAEYTIPAMSEISDHPDGYNCVYRIDGKSVSETSYGYALQHVVVAESVLGRKLNPKEVVHHIDENKKNNHPSNIIIFKTKGDHTRFHVKPTVMLKYDPVDHTFTSF